MSEIERLNMIAEWQEQHKQLIEDFDNSKKRIAELEKENAELKRDNEGYEKDNTRLVNKFNQTSAKLTKAKEIIKNLMKFAEMDDREYEKEYKEAEQFLNENSTYERIQKAKYNYTD